MRSQDVIVRMWAGTELIPPTRTEHGKRALWSATSSDCYPNWYPSRLETQENRREAARRIMPGHSACSIRSSC